MTAAYISSILIVCFLIFQHMNITKETQQRHHFYKSWKSYRNHILFCRFMSLLGAATVLAIAMEAYHDVDLGVTLAVVTLLSTREYATLIVLTFFIAILHLLVEEHVEARLRRYKPEVKHVWLHDVWLMWFSASIVLSVFLGGFDLLSEETIMLHKHKLAALSVVVVVFTYDFWIYNVLYRQLTDGDGFTGSAVARIYGVKRRKNDKSDYAPIRGFLGFMVRAIQYQPPAQVLVVGPRGAGKTRWLMKRDAAFHEDQEAKKESDGTLASTQKIEIATDVENVSILEGSRRTNAEFFLMMVDFPGENLGDHCNLPFELRSDVLVLMLPEDAFNPELDTQSETFHISTAQDISEYFASDENSRKTRDYMYALYFGLKMDDSGQEFRGRQQSGVGAFALVVNCIGSRKYDKEFKKHIHFLSRQIAEKYGVRNKQRIFSYYFDIVQHDEPILRQTIGSLHNEVVDGTTTEAEIADN